MTRYYSIMRPIGPGTFPYVFGNRATEIVNFDSREYVEEIGRTAWGYIEYEHELDQREAECYELVCVT